MKVFTSYYARVKMLREAGVVPVAIAVKPPYWFKGENIKELAPTWEILNKIKADGDEKSYYVSFKKLLDNLDREEIKAKIKEISDRNDGKPVALLCYEKVTDFCHRHIVADWLNEDDEVEVVEFNNEKHYCEIMKAQRAFWTD